MCCYVSDCRGCINLRPAESTLHLRSKAHALHQIYLAPQAKKVSRRETSKRVSRFCGSKCTDFLLQLALASPGDCYEADSLSQVLDPGSEALTVSSIETLVADRLLVGAFSSASRSL